MMPAETITCKQAEAEHQAAHGDEALHRQLETDQEQKEDDAELGQRLEVRLARHREPVNPRRLIGEGAEAGGAQHRAGNEETQDGAYLHALEQGHDDGRRGQDDHDVPEQAQVLDDCFHALSPQRLTIAARRRPPANASTSIPKRRWSHFCNCDHASRPATELRVENVAR